MVTWQLQLAPRQLLLTTTLLVLLLRQTAAICENGISTGNAGSGSATYRTIAYCPLNISSGADANIFPVTTSCPNSTAIPDWSFQLHDVTPGTPSKYTWGYIYHTVYKQIGQDIDGVDPPHAWVDSDLSVQLAHIAIHCSSWAWGQPPCLANVALILSCPIVQASGFGPVAPSGEPAWNCENYPEQCRALGIPVSTPAPPTPALTKTPGSSASSPPSDEAATDPPVVAPNPPPLPGRIKTYFNYTEQMGGQGTSGTQPSGAKKKVSVWVIVGAVIGGLLLLIILEEVIRHYRNKHREKKRVAAEEVVSATGGIPQAPEVAAAGAVAGTGTKPPGLRSRSASLVEKGAYKPAG